MTWHVHVRNGPRWQSTGAGGASFEKQVEVKLCVESVGDRHFVVVLRSFVAADLELRDGERLLLLTLLRNSFEEMDRPPQLQYEQNWDATIDHTLRRFVYGSLSGAASALLFFRSPTTRWAAVAFGAGAGIGSALTDSSQLFRASSPPVSSPSPVVVPEVQQPEAPEPKQVEAPPKLERFEEPLVQEAQDA